MYYIGMRRWSAAYPVDFEASEAAHMRFDLNFGILLRTAAIALPVVTLAATRPAASPMAAPAAVAEAAVAVAAPAAVVPVNEVDAAVEEALRSLSRHVTRQSDPSALRVALEAYYRYREANPTEVRKPYLYFVDLGLSNGTARGYVFDMDRRQLVEGPFMVAHGRGSSAARNGVPTRFSNRPGSYMSSLGLYLAQETYTFRGKSAGRSYSSVGLRMRGESGEFNDAARARGIVAHGAPYVTNRASGRSEGCPAMEQTRASRLLPLIANGGVVFIYSPRDERWLQNDPWING